MQHIKRSSFYIFSIVILMSFLVHYFVLKNLSIPLKVSKLIESYIINVFLVYTFFMIIKLFLDKIKTNLGFIFIAFSLLKFILFFIFIYPTYSLDSIITKLEISSFFIPYFICLIGEVLLLSKLLNNLKF